MKSSLLTPTCHQTDLAKRDTVTDGTYQQQEDVNDEGDHDDSGHEEDDDAAAE